MARRKEAAQEESLFRAQVSAAHPLADRMRPLALDEVVGQQHLLGAGKLLSQMVAARTFHSMILWGPPGTGKTTLAILLARQSGAVFRSIAAVSSGVAELREIAELARREATMGRRTVLFIDEIHRWNRAQQDACLPHVENGLFTLIGATTENPSFEVIAPLLSRMQVLVLKPLAPEELAALVTRALGDRVRGLGALELRIDDPAMGELLAAASGDARRALNTLEIAAELARQVRSGVITAEHVREAGQQRTLLYDRSGDEHYNVISAFIKSLRGSDADAALYWMMRMVEAGEEPLFIARRMVIFAAEDIGNADPRALQVAIAVKDGLEFVGMPEGAIPLAQGVTYLAGAPKSNASYRAMLAAGEDARKLGALPVPMHIRNAPTPLMRGLGYGEGYRYPHNYQDAIVEQDYLPESLSGKTYYEPSERGYEARIRDYLTRVKQARAARSHGPDKKD
jgi:putative ATPase